MKKFEIEDVHKYKIEHEPQELIDNFISNIRDHINKICQNKNAGNIIEIKELYEKNERLTYILWRDIFVGMVLDRRRESNHGEYDFHVNENAFEKIKIYCKEICDD